MRNRREIRIIDMLREAALWILAASCAISAYSQTTETPAVPGQRAVLDRVVAVVNNHAILASDLDDEIRLSVLDPATVEGVALTRPRALEQLISRALIQQQIREEDAHTLEPPHSEVDARLLEIRIEVPICVRQNCASDAGWKAFLAANGLTTERVDSYLRYRLEILRFIELRFRQGILISHEEIQNYYQKTLVPQYTEGQAVPTLDAVAPRIEEILLQQQVNVMFDEWLKNLRAQGDVEVLDPALNTVETQGVGTNGEGRL
jgi:peptidyl-prolyl cis-trans isomerase SurA